MNASLSSTPTFYNCAKFYYLLHNLHKYPPRVQDHTGTRKSSRINYKQPTTLSSQLENSLLHSQVVGIITRFSELLNKKNYFSLSWVKFTETGLFEILPLSWIKLPLIWENCLLDFSTKPPRISCTEMIEEILRGIDNENCKKNGGKKVLTMWYNKFSRRVKYGNRLI